MIKEHKKYKKYEGKWILLDEENDNVLYSDDDVGKVTHEGRKYDSYRKLIIMRIFKPGKAFY